MTAHTLTPLGRSNGLKNATQWIHTDGDGSACPAPSGWPCLRLSALLTHTHPGELTARSPCQQGRVPSQTRLSRPAPRPNASLLWPAASWVSPRDVRPGHRKLNVSKRAASRCLVSPSGRGRLSVPPGTTGGSLYSPLCLTPRSIRMILPSDCTRAPSPPTTKVPASASLRQDGHAPRLVPCLDPSLLPVPSTQGDLLGT